jgi:hypothetical protein
MRMQPEDNPTTLARLRVFVETDPVATCSAAVLRALAERAVQLVIAVQPATVRGIARLVGEARGAGVSVALWPMLHDADGRWANSGNAELFERWVFALLEELVREGAGPDELCLDLEPPIAQLRKMIDRRVPAAAIPGDRDAAVVALQRAIDHARELGITSWATVVPFVLADDPARATWQRLLGTPVDALALRRVCVMLYSTLAVGYTRGLLQRRHADALLWECSQRARARFGARAAVALGAIGRGALGDEAVYRDVDELRRDVAIARGAGIEELALFELGGALARPPLEPWLDALCETEPIREAPPSSRRVRALLGALDTVARAGALGRR